MDTTVTMLLLYYIMCSFSISTMYAHKIRIRRVIDETSVFLILTARPNVKFKFKNTTRANNKSIYIMLSFRVIIL